MDRHFVFLPNYLTLVRAKKQAPTTVRSIQRSDCFMGVKSASWQLGMVLIYFTQCTPNTCSCYMAFKRIIIMPSQFWLGYFIKQKTFYVQPWDMSRQLTQVGKKLFWKARMHYGPSPGEIIFKILRLLHLWIGNFLKLTMVVVKCLNNDSKIGRNEILWLKVGDSFFNLV